MPAHPRVLEDWSGINADWVTAALRGRHPHARVAEVKILWRDDGTNRRLRLGLRYAQGSGPATLFVKANEPAHRTVHLRNGNLFNEAQLFADDTALPVDHPRVYEAVVDRDGGNFLLVMEDLVARGADPRDATRPLSMEQAMNGVRGLARLHSRYWAFCAATHPALAWVQTWAPTEGWQVGLRNRVPRRSAPTADRRRRSRARWCSAMPTPSSNSIPRMRSMRSQALDDERAVVGRALPMRNRRLVAGTAVPGPRIRHARKLEHDDAVRRSAFQRFERAIHNQRLQVRIARRVAVRAAVDRQRLGIAHGAFAQEDDVGRHLCRSPVLSSDSRGTRRPRSNLPN
jgi:hypothetical protein